MARALSIILGAMSMISPWDVAPVRSAGGVTLTVTPITWDIMGLDSNNVLAGPNKFPIGVKVCNIGSVTASNVTVALAWTTAEDPYINLQSGTNASVAVGALASGSSGSCASAYFNVEITRHVNAYTHTRGYLITATDSGTGTTATSPSPRQVYVERLVSQNRNSTSSILVDGKVITSGSTLDLLQGETYTFTLNSSTSTQGYEQLEAFLSLPNNIFQVTSVSTTYSANTSPNVSNPNPMVYADACRWDANPASPNYRSCLDSSLKSGGNNITTYSIRIASSAAGTYNLQPVIYDFSGSSFHYNSDAVSATLQMRIVSPESVTLSKSFDPKSVAPGGNSTLTFTINNPNGITVSGVKFTDTLPSGVTVATDPIITYTGCGPGAFDPIPTVGATTLSFSNGTVEANSTCTISISDVVTAADTQTTYKNTTTNLFIEETTDTGSFGSDSLVTKTAAACVEGVTLASWTVPSSATAPPDSGGAKGPPQVAGSPTIKSSRVATATVEAHVGANQGIVTAGAGGASTYAWEIWGFKSDGQYLLFTVDTSKFSKIHFEYYVANPGSGNGPKQILVETSTDGGVTWPDRETTTGTPSSPIPSTFTKHSIDLSAAGVTNPSGNTLIKITPSNATLDTNSAQLQFDLMTFTGCSESVPAPTIDKAFSPTTITVDSSSTMTFTIENTAAGSVDLSGLAFSDILPVGLSVATASGIGCGGTYTTTAPRTVSLSGGSLAAGGSCSFSVTVTGTTKGNWTNVTDFISSTETGSTGNFASASINVFEKPLITKSFSPAAILTGTTSTLTFIITNPNGHASLSGLNFTDTLPDDVTHAFSEKTLSSQCGGTLTLESSNSIALTGGTLAAGASCTFTVTVTGSSAGTKTNTTDFIGSTEAGSGTAATADLVIADPIVALDMVKQIAASATGPWRKSLPVKLNQTVYYRFTLTNNGQTEIYPAFAISDPMLAPVSCNATTTAFLAGGDGNGDSVLDPEESLYCTGSYVVTSDNINSGTVTNTATATGKASAGDGASTITSNTSTATFTAAAITLTKTATQTGFTHAGQVLDYQYLVKNTGSASLEGPVTVTDNKTTVTCPAISTVGDNDDYFDPNETMTCTATYTVKDADVIATTLTNTATANVADSLISGGVTSASSSVTLAYTPIADLKIEKWVLETPPIFNGGSVSFTIRVTNLGPSTVSDAKLQDGVPSSLVDPAVSCTSGTDDPATVGVIEGPGLCVDVSKPSVDQLKQTGGFGLPKLAAGQTYSITVSGKADVDGSGGGSLSNTAMVSSALLDPITGDPSNTKDDNNSATTSAMITAVADLKVEKIADVASSANGGSVSFTIRVTNLGPSTVSDAKLQDGVPSQLVDPTVKCTEDDPATLYTVESPGLCTSSTDPDSASALTPWFDLPELAAGQTYSITVSGKADVDGSGGGSLSNTAMVSSALLDPITGDISISKESNNTSSASVNVTSVADLKIEKVVKAATVANDGTVSYMVTVTNLGPSTVSDAKLQDGVPSQLVDPTVKCTEDDPATLYTVESPGLCTSSTDPDSASALTSWFDLPELAAGQTYSITVSGKADVDGSSGGSFANTAKVTSALLDPLNEADPGNNSSIATVTVTPVADLKVEKTPDVVTVANGGTVSYTVTVTNLGPSTVTDAKMVDSPGAGFTITKIECATSQSIAPESGTVERCHNGLFNANPSVDVTALKGSGFGPLTMTSGQKYTLRVTGTVSVPAVGGGTVDNAVNVSSSTSDPVMGNNFDNTSNTITVTTRADLSITKTNSVGAVKDGASTTYTITVTNFGPSSVIGALLADPVADGLDVTMVSCAIVVNIPSTEKCVPLTQPSITALQGSGFALPQMSAGDTYTIKVTATVSTDAATLSNVAMVTPPSDTPDPTPGNNASSDTDDVTKEDLVDLAVTRNNFIYWLNTGQATTYVLTVTNNGPSSVTGAKLFDPIVPDLLVTHVECASPGGGQCSGRDLLPTDAPSVAASIAKLQGSGLVLPFLAAGDTYVIKVTATVQRTYVTPSTVSTSSLGPNEFPSYASVTAPPGVLEPNLDNNQAQEVDAIAPPGAKIADLVITKTNDVNTVQYDTATTYTISVRNNGPSDVTGAVIKDIVSAPLNPTGVVCAYAPVNADLCDENPSLSALTVSGITVNLKVGETYTIRLTAAAPTYFSDPRPTSITNVATVKPPADILEANNASNDPNYVESATDIDQLKTPVADVAVTKADDVDALINGTSTTYTITVVNNGPAPVSGGRLKDPAVANMTVTSVTCAPPTPNETCDVTQVPMSGDVASIVTALQSSGLVIPDLEPGEKFTIRVGVTIDIPELARAATVTNTALVVLPDGTYEGNEDNNSSSDTNYVDPLGDLAVTKTDGVATVKRGSATTYTIVVTNNGPGSVANSVLTDPVVAGLDVTAIACGSPAGQCTTPPTVSQLQAGLVLPTLASGQTYVLRVTATVSTKAAMIANAVTIAPPAGITDPSPSNNAASDSNTVKSKSRPHWPEPISWTNPPQILTGGPLTGTGISRDSALYTALVLIGVGTAILAIRRRRQSRR